MYINYWAVLVSAIVSMIIGSIWYGPLFGKKYMEAMGMDKWSEEEKAKMRKSMVSSYVGQFVASLVSFYVLAWFIGGLNQMTAMGGLTVGFLVWLGFNLPLKLGDILWGGNKKVFWLSVGANLVTLLIVGAIIGAWK